MVLVVDDYADAREMIQRTGARPPAVPA